MKIRLKDATKQHNRRWSVQEMTLKDVDTKEILVFNFAAHVGENLTAEETLGEYKPEYENKLNLKHNEIESYALRHDQPVLPSECCDRLLFS